MFKSIYGDCIAEIVEKKSRFIAIASGINSDMQARKIIDEQRKKYYDARHVTYAYILSDGTKKCSDDGEPAKTAGIPILKILEYGNFFCSIIVVVRYFGGILLGTGGLARAYSDAAKKVLDNAVVIENKLYEEITMRVGYEHLNKINYELMKNNCFINESMYDSDIKMIFYVQEEIADKMLDEISKFTCAKLIVENRKKIFGAVAGKKFISCEEK